MRIFTDDFLRWLWPCREIHASWVSSLGVWGLGRWVIQDWKLNSIVSMWWGSWPEIAKQETRRDGVKDLCGDLCLRPYKQMIPILDKAVRWTSFKKTRECNGTACKKCNRALVFQFWPVFKVILPFLGLNAPGLSWESSSGLCREAGSLHVVDNVFCWMSWIGKLSEPLVQSQTFSLLPAV